MGKAAQGAEAKSTQDPEAEGGERRQWGALQVIETGKLLQGCDDVQMINMTTTVEACTDPFLESHIFKMTSLCTSTASTDQFHFHAAHTHKLSRIA